MITEASLFDFLQTLLIVILVILGLRLVIRLLAPYAIRYFIKRLLGNINKKFQQTQNHYEQRQKQTINDAKSQSQNPQSKKKVGEYIDFEEIE